MNNWIEHLQHPLVLTGFGLFVFAAVLKPLFLNKVSGAAVERLMRRGINFVFILALLTIIGGFAQSRETGSVAKTNTATSTGDPDSGTAEASVEQSTQGDQSPAINSGKDVQVTYGAVPSDQKKLANGQDIGAAEHQAVQMQVEQTTQGEKSPAVNAQGNVEINYAK